MNNCSHAMVDKLSDLKLVNLSPEAKEMSTDEKRIFFKNMPLHSLYSLHKVFVLFKYL